MLPPLLLPTSLRLSVAVALTGALFLRVFLRPLWNDRRVRGAYGACVVVLLGAHAAWSVGMRHYPICYWGAATATTVLLLLGLLVASLPVAGLVRVVATRLVLPRRPGPSLGQGAPLTRRAVIQAATAVVPAVALATGIDGFLRADAPARTPRVPLRFPGLAPALEGFTILQLSDLHLGLAREVGDLEALLSPFDRSDRRPDLVVFTGDVADDLRQLPDALEAAWALRPKHGVFACLGNHEYLHDIRVSRPLYERSHVPLLVDRGAPVKLAGARLWVAGTDDPVMMRGDIRGLLRASVDRSLDGAPNDAFRLLLSHRPEGFDPASGAGVDLTLSGHTHGGQIGFNGKSAFQPLYEDGYLWGAYARGRSRLYTTSGFGHWFPFRVGCPTEAPVIVLTAG